MLYYDEVNIVRDSMLHFTIATRKDFESFPKKKKGKWQLEWIIVTLLYTTSMCTVY